MFSILPAGMLILGLSNMRDAAAALVEDGRIVAAAEEERFLRIKHVTALPVQAIRHCLAAAGIRLCDLDAVAVPWKYWEISRRAWLAIDGMWRSPQLCRVKMCRSAERLSQEWKELVFLRRYLSFRVDGTSCPPPVFLDHHLSHAASAMLVSPWDRAAVLVVDGASESHTTTLAEADRSCIRFLKRVPLPHSLGQFYAAITGFLGFIPDQDEYIVMGLAAYGEPRFAAALRQHVLPLQPDGTFRLHTGLLDFHLARKGIFSARFMELFGPPRFPREELTQRHRDMAASVQAVLEETLLHLARELRRLSGINQLCLAGGVAYNCVANSRLLREAGFDEIYVPPAPGDSGAALGAALWLANRRGALTHRTVMRTASWGPSYDEQACRAALGRGGLEAEHYSDEELCESVAKELAAGRLVFWFQGKMELGPRALGNRSLLADPRREDMRALINAKVKLREPFRPFAPSVLDERAKEYFDFPGSSPFMLFTAPVRASAKGTIPAVVHVDGSARVQTVDSHANGRYRLLLQAFERITGVPVLLNTSFNVNEPIVCTPDDAVRCFLRTEVEWLVMGNLMARRPTHRRPPGTE
ncbi:MAG TPA: carbamoyltransferase C-terminal domain-containing protein [Nitrospira sp.]|nr:carbamoyltransferase C-terminal domain-containing protein [Nitrospira sp.]